MRSADGSASEHAGRSARRGLVPRACAQRTRRARSSPASPRGAWRAALATLLAFGCGERAPAPPRSFELEQIAPKERELFLNHPLVLRFSEPVAPSSITSESLRIRTVADGKPARGVFRVEGKQVQFVPDPPLAADLLDGGFLPGTRYEVRVAGFPLPDGIVSVDGLPLRCSYRSTFTTVPLSDSPRDLFRDRTLGYSERLRLVNGRRVGGEWELVIEPESPILLECDEPLHPPSVSAKDFSLRRVERGGTVPIPFDLVLVENQDAGDAFPLGVARLELRPSTPLVEGLYLLTYADRPLLSDLGGNGVAFWPRPIDVRVVSLVGGHVEAFLDPDDRSSLPVPGADGTAWWSSSGVATIRFPRAAGDGRDGEVRLVGTNARADIQATRLAVVEGAECELTAAGLVVLRAQGALRVSGKLARRAAQGPPVTWRPGERLSDWLERAQRDDPPWTVLIAGGDLVIDGRVETDGPLVLVAGGWIRASGVVRQEESQLWLLGEGGGMLLDPTRSSMDLELDPPLHNPLATTLRYAVLSVPLPSEGQVETWLGAEARGRDGGGTWRVRYLPFWEPGSSAAAAPELFRAALRGAAGTGSAIASTGLGLSPAFAARIEGLARSFQPLEAASAQQLDAAEDPQALDGARKLRLWIELEIGPARPGDLGWSWLPPMVDEVRLQWQWDRAEGAR